jgi:hypothetical protein
MLVSRKKKEQMLVCVRHDSCMCRGLTDGQLYFSAVLEGTVLPCGRVKDAKLSAAVIAVMVCVSWQNPPAGGGRRGFLAFLLA